MSDAQAPGSMTDLVRRIVEQLQAAGDAANAAAASAATGDTAAALVLLRDIERPLFEVTILLNAASILRGDHAS